MPLCIAPSSLLLHLVGWAVVEHGLLMTESAEISLYEAIEITEHDFRTISLNQRVIRVCEMENDPATKDRIQKTAVMI